MYRFCPAAGICRCSSLYLHLCNLAVHPYQVLYQDPTLFMSLPPSPSDLQLTLSLLHPHLYNAPCHFTSSWRWRHQVPWKCWEILTQCAQCHILDDLNHRHQGNFVRKEIWAVLLKCIILSHFQSFSLEYNVAESFSSHILFGVHVAFYFICGKTDFYFVFCNLTASDCEIQINCKASHIVYSFIVIS